MEKQKREQRDLTTEGAKDRLKGTAKKTEGRIRDAVGGLTGNTREQLKGKGQQAKGGIQKTIGKAKQKADRDRDPDEI